MNDPNRADAAAVYCGFDWTGYHCEFEDGGDCGKSACIVGASFARDSRRLHGGFSHVRRYVGF